MEIYKETAAVRLEHLPAPGGAAVRVMSAFANTEGGVLKVGVDADGAPRGVAEEELEHWRAELERIVREDVAPPIADLARVERRSTDAGAWLEVAVRSGARRPYAALEGEERLPVVYIRRGGRSAEAKPSLVAEMRAAPAAPWDRRASLNPNPTFLEARRLGLEADVAGAEMMSCLRTFRTEDGAWSKAAEVFSDQSGFALRCVAEDAGDDQVFSGGLLTILFGALGWLEARGAGRFGLALVREALVNALLHRDYGVADSRVLVRLSAGALEVTSPGGLPPGMTREDVLGGLSRVRNPGVLDALHALGLARGLGDGVRRMAKLLAGRGGALEVEALPGALRVTLLLDAGNDAAEAPAQPSAPAPAAPLRQADDLRLSAVERAALDFLAEHPGASRRAVQDAVGLSQAGTINLLKRLVFRGGVLVEGNGPSTRYRLRG